jgi:acetyl-CoA acetyltransferase
MARARGLRGQTAVVGVGESEYSRHGRAKESEFALCIRSILAAVKDAGLRVDDIDGFVSYAGDRNDPPRLAAALGIPELRLSAMQATTSGGGSAGHIALAAAAINSGLADCVVVYRALAQGQFGRFGLGGYTGSGPGASHVSGYGPGASSSAYGLFSPPQKFALRGTRLLEKLGVDRATFRAVARAAYHHAQSNPRAVMYGRPLEDDDYERSRWIAEPFHLFDCCMENDAAAAMIMVSAERAKDVRDDPVYILAACQGGSLRSGVGGENPPDYATAGFKPVARRLFEGAGLTPADVDVLQVYDNFTAGVVMAIIEHGFCRPEEAGDVLTFDNLIAPDGKLPLNTSGGNFAEAYILGMQLHLEAVRQLRGESCNQVPGAQVCLSAGGPMTPLSTSVIFGTGAVL